MTRQKENSVSDKSATAHHTIDMGEYADAWAGQTVTVRAHQSYAASQRIEMARMQMETNVRGGRRRGGDDDVRMVANVTPIDYAAAVVDECVLEWTLLGIDGNPLACSRAGLTSKHAPAALLDCVIEAVVDYYEEQVPLVRKHSKQRA